MKTPKRKKTTAPTKKATSQSKKATSQSKKATAQSTNDQLQVVLNEIMQSNVDLATTQLKYILDTCFVKDPQTEAYWPIMMNFNIPNGDTSVELEVPLMTTIPITMLAIDKAEIYLKSENQNETNSTAADFPEMEYDTNIQCEQQPLPNGLAMLLEVLSNSIRPNA